MLLSVAAQQVFSGGFILFLINKKNNCTIRPVYHVPAILALCVFSPLHSGVAFGLKLRETVGWM